MRHYDVAVIGTGPAGQKAAIQAAKLGKRVAIIEKTNLLGGAQINTGTIPSKALKEAAMHLTGANQRGLFGESVKIKRNITIADLIGVSRRVIQNEWQVIRDALDRNDVEIVWGKAKFQDAHTLAIDRGPDEAGETITADKFILATGTKPAKPTSIPFNDKTILTSDSLLFLPKLPKSMIVVGGGVIGVEYACMLAVLGVRVILVEGRHSVLGFLDDEITEAFQYHMRHMGITLRMGEKVAKIEEIPAARADSFARVCATLESGKSLQAETLLYCVGREGTTKELGLDKVGLVPDDRQRLKVNEKYQTDVPHIFAVGDIIGFPALASTAMEQGRLAALYAFGQEAHSMSELFPYGIYALPEISMVGKTEQQLTQEGVPYEAGIANYREIARGQLLGDDTGMLKLLIHQKTHAILGVHIIGTQATELVHIGQAAMAFNATAEFFVQNVFNYPTLAEAYKIAALNGLNKINYV
jgi:NAD(P) transhydrogenase